MVKFNVRISDGLVNMKFWIKKKAHFLFPHRGKDEYMEYRISPPDPTGRE